MTPKLWFIYITLFLLASFIDNVGHASLDPVAADDINVLTGYQVDELSSGSGFLGLIRTSVAVTTTLIPKFVTWNFGFLSGDLQFVQWVMIFVFGGLLITTRFIGDKSLLQRIF